MDIDAVEFGKQIGQVIREAIAPLKDRIAELEGRVKSVSISKSLDEEAYGELAEVVGRLERLESSISELSDNGFRYRGFYRNGDKAKRGDAYTHDGSLWYCLRNTEDKPCRESNDWNVVARKGRDAS